MNIYQRIVLVCGAIALIVAIWTAPKVRIEGLYVAHYLASPPPPPPGYEFKKSPSGYYELKEITPSNLEQSKPPELKEISPSDLAINVPQEYRPLNAPLMDLRTVLARSIAVIGSTLLACFALKDLKPRKTQ